MHNLIITVFGGNGFIGKYVVRYLIKEGWRVRVASRMTSDTIKLKVMGELGQVDSVKCDITNIRDVQIALKGSTAAINLIGILKPTKHNSFNDIHFLGVKNILSTCMRNDIRHFVHISALGAKKESSSEYSKSKYMGEEAIQRVMPKAVILKPSVVYGEEDKFLNMFANIVSKSPIIPLIGSGVTKFQPIWVDDLAQIIVDSLKVSKSRKNIFEIGGKDILSLKDIFLWINHEIGVKRKFLNIPFGLANKIARIIEVFPMSPLTRDQVTLLKEDNVLSNSNKGMKKFKIVPQPFRIAASKQMERFKKRGGHI